MYYLCEALLPEFHNIEHEVAAEPLLVKVHLPSESLHLHLHKIKLKQLSYRKYGAQLSAKFLLQPKRSQGDSVCVCVWVRLKLFSRILLLFPPFFRQKEYSSAVKRESQRRGRSSEAVILRRKNNEPRNCHI
jgi:hypothetical protein